MGIMVYKDPDPKLWEHGIFRLMGIIAGCTYHQPY